MKKVVGRSWGGGQGPPPHGLLLFFLIVFHLEMIGLNKNIGHKWFDTNKLMIP